MVKAGVALAIVVLGLLVAGCGGNGTKPTGAATPAASTAASAAQTPKTAPVTNPAATTTAPSTTAPPTTPAPAKAQERVPLSEKVAVTSPAIHSGVLSARYTCDGADTPPPLHIEGVPPGTAELMLDIIKIKPVDNKLYFPWAVAHIKPTTRNIVGGKLPPGAIVGTNGNGKSTYDLCPPKGPAEGYVAVLFALPHELRAKPGFDPMKLRREAERTATYQNLYIFNYKRR
jgi:phosphatidylethanolamine-binding protein (PEBP) family uncharacterized protein